MDRDAQFHHINDQAKAFLAAGEPVISVDTKKKELVGDFKNAGREWELKGQPEEVRVQTISKSASPTKGRWLHTESMTWDETSEEVKHRVVHHARFFQT